MWLHQFTFIFGKPDYYITNIEVRLLVLISFSFAKNHESSTKVPTYINPPIPTYECIQIYVANILWNCFSLSLSLCFHFFRYWDRSRNWIEHYLYVFFLFGFLTTFSTIYVGYFEYIFLVVLSFEFSCFHDWVVLPCVCIST